MKIIISILLLFVIGIYILPVKEMLNKESTIWLTDINEEKEETEKKEKSKELFYFNTTTFYISKSICTLRQHIIFNIPVSHYTVDSPPPDYTS